MAPSPDALPVTRWGEREYGYRARIGLIVPANNQVIEPEFNRMAPEGVAVYATRLPARGRLTEETFREMERGAAQAVEDLASAGVHVIAFADMGIAFVMEEGWGERRVERIREQTGLPATTGALAMLEALRALGVRRIALATPYPKSLHARAAPFFERRGYRVVSDETLDIEDMHRVGRVRPDEVYALARRVDRGEAEALLILATDLRSIEVLQPLEEVLKKPVFSTNSALFWECLRLAGLRVLVSGYGRLLSEKSP